MSSLATLCHQLRKRSLLKAADKVAPLLQHPSAAVRHSAVACIAAIARVLPPVDVYAQLAVMVADRVQQQPLMLTGEGGGASTVFQVIAVSFFVVNL